MFRRKRLTLAAAVLVAMVVAPAAPAATVDVVKTEESDPYYEIHVNAGAADSTLHLDPGVNSVTFTMPSDGDEGIKPASEEPFCAPSLPDSVTCTIPDYGAQGTWVRVWMGAGNDGVTAEKPNRLVQELVISLSAHGGDGNDNIYADNMGYVELYGDAGADTLFIGHEWASFLRYPSKHAWGGDGNDFITAQYAFGENGNDFLQANPDAGHDGSGLVGGAGDDELRGGAGNDFLDGELGTDVMFSGEGADTIDAYDRRNRDTAACGLDDDLVYADHKDALGNCESVLFESPPEPPW